MAELNVQLLPKSQKGTRENVTASYNDSQLQAPKRWWTRQKPLLPKPFPFLKLPAEVRHLIYQYTVPDVLVERPRHRKRKKAPLREDGTKCCVGLLRTNRQIYNELHNAWYCKVPFRVDIRWGSLFYLKHCTFDWKNLRFPSTFFQHSKLSIRMKFEPYNSKSSRAREAKLLSALVDLLGPGHRRKSPLQELTFEFLIPPLTELRYHFKKPWSEFTGIVGLLDTYLEPLRRIRGQGTVTVTVRQRYPLRFKRLIGHQQQDQWIDAAHWAEAHKVMEELSRDMTSAICVNEE